MPDLLHRFQASALALPEVQEQLVELQVGRVEELLVELQEEEHLEEEPLVVLVLQEDSKEEQLVVVL